MAITPDNKTETSFDEFDGGYRAEQIFLSAVQIDFRGRRNHARGEFSDYHE